MLGGVEPDFQIISDNGSKFNACNSKDINFTKNKLDDRRK